MSEVKKTHRLEPKKNLETSSFKQVGEAIPSQPVFIEQEFVEECVEEDWNEVSPEVRGKGGKWLLCGIGVFSLFFVVCSVWSVFLLSGKAEVEQQVARVEATADPFEVRKQVVEKYFMAASLEEKSRWVRFPERVTALMKDHYQKFSLIASQDVKVRGENPVIIEGKTLWQIHSDVDHKRVQLLVEMQTDGSAKIDWELDVVYQSTDFDEFLSQRSTEPNKFRVLIQGAQLEGFHGYTFSSYNKYRCYKVTIPHRDEYLWAYAEIGSDLDKQWFNFVTSGLRESFDRSKPKPVTLELYFPENSQTERCVHIGKMLKPGWLH